MENVVDELLERELFWTAKILKMEREVERLRGWVKGNTTLCDEDMRP